MKLSFKCFLAATFLLLCWMLYPAWAAGNTRAADPKLPASYPGILHGEVDGLGDAQSAAVLQQRLKLLAARDVVVIIDKSGSMGTHDCPGGLSRWQWCAKQTSCMAGDVGRLLKNGLTVVVFSDDFQVYPHTTFDTIASVFKANTPQGGTHIELALGSVFADYFRRREADPKEARPLSIAVVTDGEPSELEQLRDEIIQATRQMTRPDEISICFLKVGTGTEGNAVLEDLHDDLPDLGAKYNIVDYKTFEDLQAEGLAIAMTDALTDANQSPVASQPAPEERSAPGSAPPAQDATQKKLPQLAKIITSAGSSRKTAQAHRSKAGSAIPAIEAAWTRSYPGWSRASAASWTAPRSGWSAAPAVRPMPPFGMMSLFGQVQRDRAAIEQELLNSN